jgi:hypothetical protein
LVLERGEQDLPISLVRQLKQTLLYLELFDRSLGSKEVTTFVIRS